MRGLALGLAGLVVLGGCEKSKTKIPDDPQPRPAALIATIAMPNASALLPLRDVVAAINTSAAMAVDPTIVTMSATSGVGAASLEAIDSDAPMYALWLDDGNIRGLAVVGKIKPDADDALAKLKPAEALDKNGWIVVASSKEILAMAAPYALTTVVATPPTRPNAVVYVPGVIAHYSDQITAWRNTAIRRIAHGSPLNTASVASYVDGIVGAIRQTDEIRVVLEPDKDRASIDLTLVPKPESTLAGFVAAQKPSAFGLATKLPDKLGPAILAGRLVLGPYLDGVVKWIAGLYGNSFANALLPSYLAIVRAMTGELAASGDVSGEDVSLYVLAGLDDQQAVEAALDPVQAAFNKGASFAVKNGKVVYKAAPDVTVDGVTLHVDKTITTTVPPAKTADPKDPKKADPKAPVDEIITTRQATSAVFDKLLMVCGSKDPVADATRGIEVVRGKTPGYAPPAPFAAEIDAAKGRNDSLVGAFDAASLGGKGIATISVGFAAKTIHLRFTLPAAVVRSLRP